MGQDPLQLSALEWTVRASASGPAWQQVPEPLRARIQAGVPATVPGCVHTDLMTAGLLEDPYPGVREPDQDWVGEQTWTYACVFGLGDDSPEIEAENVHLECDGLDTVAEVLVNGLPVGRSVNMHRRNVFAIRALLRVGINQLEIVFAPAIAYIAEQKQLLGERPHVERDDYNLIRKNACNFGWDWGPRLITAGIWRPIRLQLWNHARVLDVAVHGTASRNASGQWVGHLRVQAHLTGELRFAAVTVKVSGRDVSGAAGVPAADWTEATLDITGVEPWWPHSLGAQPLYDVEVVFHNDTDVLDRVHRRTGFRSVELDTTPDADGEGATFGLVINGEQVFVRGANWIPDDCFVSRVTPQRYRERVQQAKDANIDLLRIWGGGIYESQAFYDACDELGVMVWQDFCLACAAYPEEEPLWSELEAEARDNVMRLSAHPSLVLWNGNNENIWGHDEWHWAERPGGDKTWGAGYYYQLFPQVLGELDTSRPYWHGSPSSGSPDVRPNDPDYGCTHIWDVWNERDYTGYDDYTPRFVSEFGYQGPATWATWSHAVEPADRAAGSPVLLAHQKAQGGNDKLNRGIEGHLPVPGEGPDDFDDWLYAMQLQQARAVRYGIERWRSLRGRCLGSIVWQLNDCWPVTSWAALDSGTDSSGRPVARRKLLWYALRSAYADHLVTLQRPADDADGWRLALVNDGRSDWTAQGRLELRSLDGEVLWSYQLARLVPARSRVDVLIRPDAVAADERELALVVTLSGAERYVRLLTEDVHAALPPARLEASVAPTAAGVDVTVTAASFLRSLSVFADRVSENAEADTAMVDLFPGESHTFHLCGDFAGCDLAQLTRAPVLRSLADSRTPSEAI
ncbi:MAG: glycoside hydrolase family 2 protein [Micropruina sp.]|nr:glycoside hydrolase family 2 protein [Micropruina sp.]